VNHTLDQLRIQQRVTKARLARLYELMRDPDYPIDMARAGVREEKAKLARFDAEIAAGTTTPPPWGVEDYQAALQDGLGDI
jgi:hypothetical protein